MSFWNIFGIFATSDKGETITRVSDHMSISSKGVSYTTMGDTTVGSDGSSYTRMGDFSSDGSTRMGSFATGRGAVFNGDRDDDMGLHSGHSIGRSRDPFAD